MAKKRAYPLTRTFNGKIYRKHGRGVLMERRMADRIAKRLRVGAQCYRARVVPIRIKGRTGDYMTYVIYKRRC